MKNKNILCLGIWFFFISISSQEIFKKNDATSFQYKISENPQRYQEYVLNTKKLLEVLEATSVRNSDQKKRTILSLPNGIGAYEDFEIFEASVLSSTLSEKYPMIKSYIGKSSISNSTVRFSYAPSQGFNAAISNNKSATILIKPSSLKNGIYLLFSRKDFIEESDFECKTIEDIKKNPHNFSKKSNDGYLRKYRLAVATTAEYSLFFLDGTEVDDTERKTKVLAAINTSLTRINGVFERDFGITMELVDDNDSTIFFNPTTDPFNSDLNT